MGRIVNEGGDLEEVGSEKSREGKEGREEKRRERRERGRGRGVIGNDKEVEEAGSRDGKNEKREGGRRKAGKEKG